MWILLTLVCAGLVWWRRRSRSETPDARRELASAAMHLGRAVREGASLPEALRRTADHLRGSVADDLRRAHAAIERGAPVDEALRGWGGVTAAPPAGGDPGVQGDLALLVAAARFGQSRGGDLAAAFEGVSMTLLDRAEVADESAALSSQARASAVVLCALPVVGLAIFSAVDPKVPAALVAAPVGRLCLAGGIALDLAALWISHRLVQRALR